MAEVHYLISDASKQVDVESHVLRYWEDELELDIPRNDMGHRYYTEYHIRLFRQIKELKEKGYQLKAIKNALDKMSGVMEKITVTEDYMEEDMKAAWDKSREKAPESVWVSEPLADQTGGMPKENQKDQTGKNPGAEVREGRPESMSPTGGPEGRQPAASPKDTEKQPKEVKQMESQGEGRKKPSLRQGENQGEQANSRAAAEGTRDQSKVRTVEGVREQLKARLAEQSRVRVVEGGNMPAEMMQRNGRSQPEPAAREPVEINAEKMARFQSVMNHIIGRAMDANMDRLAREVSNTVSEDVTDKVMKEVEYLMRVSDEKEEERFRQLDETIRAYQKQGKGRAEAAATKVPFFKKKRFAKSGKKLF